MHDSKVPPALDGTIVVGRALDYPAVMMCHPCVIPKGLERSASGLDPHPGRTWTTTHGVVGLAVRGRRCSSCMS